jgi:hypothetical protein
MSRGEQQPWQGPREGVPDMPPPAPVMVAPPGDKPRVFAVQPQGTGTGSATVAGGGGGQVLSGTPVTLPPQLIGVSIHASFR